MELSCDDRHGLGGAETVSNASESDVTMFLLRLDGERFTELSINDSPDCALAVVGGAHGRFLCQRITPEGCWLLLDDAVAADVETVSLIKGEQPDYPLEYTVTQQVAVKVAIYFLAHGDLPTDQSWLQS